VNSGETADTIEPLGMVSGVSPINHALDGRVHRRHLANTVEQLCAGVFERVSATTGGDAVCSEITLGNLVNAVIHNSYYLSRFSHSE